jgi:hypothetical protein
MEFLFGEGQFGLRILLAVFLVLALIGVLACLMRVFRSERTGAASRRARQPRLAVIDAAAVDGRRRLVLIRRDNVEHLLMIGGRADIVVEPNIVRATAREPALARPPAFAEQLEAALAARAHNKSRCLSTPRRSHRYHVQSIDWCQISPRGKRRRALRTSRSRRPSTIPPIRLNGSSRQCCCAAASRGPA